MVRNCLEVVPHRIITRLRWARVVDNFKVLYALYGDGNGHCLLVLHNSVLNKQSVFISNNRVYVLGEGSLYNLKEQWSLVSVSLTLFGDWGRIIRRVTEIDWCIMGSTLQPRMNGGTGSLKWQCSANCLFYRATECRRGIAMRILFVCRSVRLSVRLSNACTVTKRKKDMLKFYRLSYEKSFSLAFWEEEWLVWGPLLPKIFG